MIDLCGGELDTNVVDCLAFITSNRPATLIVGLALGPSHVMTALTDDRVGVLDGCGRVIRKIVSHWGYLPTF